MVLMIIFALITLFAGYGVLSALRNKNFLGLFFALATFAVFGWFTVMTVLKDGYPAV